MEKENKGEPAAVLENGGYMIYETPSVANTNSEMRKKHYHLRYLKSGTSFKHS